MAEIHKAIVGMLQDCGGILKNQKNPQQGYMYRGIDAVYNEAHPLLAKYGVFPTSEILERTREERTTAKGAALIYTQLKIRYVFFAQDGSSVSTEAVGEGMDSGDKSSSKAMSMAFKYAFFQLLCIPTELLVDAEIDSHEVKGKKPRRAPGSVSKKEEPADPAAAQAKLEAEGIAAFGGNGSDDPREAASLKAVAIARIKSMVNVADAGKSRAWADHKVEEGKLTVQERGEVEQAIIQRLAELSGTKVAEPFTGNPLLPTKEEIEEAKRDKVAF